MKKITLTCPFTGVEFDALENADGSLIVQHPLTGEHMRVGFNEPSNRPPKHCSSSQTAAG